MDKKVGGGGLSLGSVMSIVGTALGMWTRFGEGVGAKDLRASIGAPIGALLFLYGALLMSWSLTVFAWHYSQPVGIPLLCIFSLLGLFSAYYVNLNYLTLHRYYRDRLMEAFLPNLAKESFVDAHSTASEFLADQGWLKNMADKANPNGPYHLINTHVVLNDTKDPKVYQRGGDSFLLSPYYCGSKTTGWLPTNQFLCGEMTVATAMAISGAAVNPNAAGAGVGPQRNKAVSLLMALLNIRLGCWVPKLRLDCQNKNPTHFTALGEAIFGCREDLSHLLLTDGGHFDNLGVYELTRRRVGCILVCDATADPEFEFSDLQNLIVRVENDFGVKIQFADMPLLDALMPTETIPYPKGMELSTQPFIVGSITYPQAGSRPSFSGVFIYLTTLMTANLRLQLYGFKGANPTFPDETTANQFFSEARFEAYRELGWTAADQMLTALANSPNLACHNHIFAKAAKLPSTPVKQGQ